MRNLKDDLKTNGSSQEEIYFHKVNRELIEKQKRRARLTLIQGGKSESDAPVTATASAGSDSSQKKAA